MDDGADLVSAIHKDEKIYAKLKEGLLGGTEETMTFNQFKAFFADCENALQAYEGEKIAKRQELKARYEAARKR